MKIIATLIAVTALPLLALGQADQPQGQTNDSHETAPAKKKKAHALHEAVKAPAPEANGGKMRAETKAEGRANTRAHAETNTAAHAKGTQKADTGIVPPRPRRR